MLLKCSFNTVILLTCVTFRLTGVAISHTRVIKTSGGMSLISDHLFLVAKGTASLIFFVKT